MRKEHFFCGLFRDLPKVLTRNIVSTIKPSVPGLDSLLKNIEQDEMQKKIPNKLTIFIACDISYWTENESSNKFIDKNGMVCVVDGCDEFILNIITMMHQSGLYAWIC